MSFRSERRRRGCLGDLAKAIEGKFQTADRAGFLFVLKARQQAQTLRYATVAAISMPNEKTSKVCRLFLRGS